MTIRLLHKILPVLLCIALIDAWFPIALAQQSQAIGSVREYELTVDFVRLIESLLANPTTNRKLEIYDRLVFGKGQFLRIDGKSRKNAVLALDGQGKYLVRLFDLANIDGSEKSLKGIKYFTGVCSNAEVTRDSVVEIRLIYASLADSAGKDYSPGALDFENRTEQSEKRNQQITSQVPPLVQPAPPSHPPPKEPVRRTTHSNSPEGQQSAGETESSEDQDTNLVSGDRPVLRRRLSGEAEKKSRSQSARDSTHSDSMGDPRDEKDVVVYRRKDSAKQEMAADTVVQGGSEVEALPASSPSRPRLTPKEADGMMLIPEGDFTLGSNDSGDTEKPLHRVLVRNFYLDKYEVTNEDYQRFCTATGHRPPPYWKGNRCPPDLEKHPVVQVTWMDAMAYALWTGKRLPTEVEWERAAKGPNSYRYAYGNAYDAKKANTELGRTVAVGSYRPNEFGLYDMTGNVNEWTSTLFAAYPYRKDDGREDPKADGPRVVRGGNFAVDDRKARCLVRLEVDPTQTTLSTGFRCARDAQ